MPCTTQINKHLLETVWVKHWSAEGGRLDVVVGEERQKEERVKYDGSDGSGKGRRNNTWHIQL